MQSVWKYAIPVESSLSITVPLGARPLCVQMQGETPTLWMLVEPENSPCSCTVRVVGTGHTAEGLYVDDYAGTFQLMDGALVFHVFVDQATQPIAALAQSGVADE